MHIIQLKRNCISAFGKPGLVLLCLLLSVIKTVAQKNDVDSLKQALLLEKDDTNKVNTFNVLYNRFWALNISDSAQVYSNKAYSLADKLNFKKGIADALRMIGILSRLQGNYAQALESDFKALDIYEGFKDKKGTATMLGNIGLVYWNQKNYTKALNYDFRALAIYQTLKDKNGIARNLSNIGIVYYEEHDLKQALIYDLQALDIDKEIGNTIGIGANLGDIGNIYLSLDSSAKALQYDFMALNLYRKTGNKNGIGRNLGNIGVMYSLAKNYKLAKIYFDSALAVASLTRDKETLKDTYFWMYPMDTINGNYNAATEDYKKYIVYRDSLQNEASAKRSIQAELNFEFEQKTAAQKAEQDKKDAITLADAKRQKIITIAILISLLLVIVFSGLLLSRFKLIQNQKNVIEKQKITVEEKNREIVDSITYAKRLQDAILPPFKVIEKYLPESFIFYRPKDIVAGDFYWLEKSGDALLVAAADCTGHGVPGAMVSVVCSNALNSAVKEFHVTEPGKVLDKARELVLETYGTNNGEVKDGMDISLCSITKKPTGTEVKWAGAFNPLLYFENGELKEIGPDKQPIGYSEKNMPYTTHTLQPEKGTMLYLFTDGYADQFGGPKGKKFKFSQLQKLLSGFAAIPIKEQKETLEKTFDEWKGKLEQVDDVLIIGLRV